MSVVLPGVRVPSVAVIVVVPAASAAERALEVGVLAMTKAVAGVPEVQATVAEGVCIEPSLHFSWAVKVSELPTATVGVPGETTRETGTGVPLTVKLVLPVTPESEAEINVVPPATAVARPLLEMVATVVMPDVQVVIMLVTSEVLVEPSKFLKVPVAANCCVPVSPMV